MSIVETQSQMLLRPVTRQMPGMSALRSPGRTDHAPRSPRAQLVKSHAHGTSVTVWGTLQRVMSSLRWAAFERVEC